jgi:methylenetetrahydrofolate dehydrogenase (NADP+)/methenyltetrahydrofolate cyclohydrolase
MTAIMMDGRALARDLKRQLKAHAARFRYEHGILPAVALALAGNDPAARIYGNYVERSCAEIGLQCITHTFPYDISEAEFRDAIAQLNDVAAVRGVVVLLPLPSHIQQRRVTEVIAPEKDVDGLGPRNAGKLMLGFPSFVPSTAAVVRMLLSHYQIPVRGQHAVVVGRSNVGGKPIALELLRDEATVTICHSRTPDLAAITRTADILVVSIGQPHAIQGDMLKPGAVVLDAGINAVNGHIAGDVDQASVAQVASYLTPVPGGLGPLTNLMLISHVLMGPD